MRNASDVIINMKTNFTSVKYEGRRVKRATEEQKLKSFVGNYELEQLATINTGNGRKARSCGPAFDDDSITIWMVCGS